MIKPEDVHNRIETVKVLERKIDAVINYATRVDRWPATLAIRGESASATINEVIKMFRDAGWDIKCVPNSYGGAHLQIAHVPRGPTLDVPQPSEAASASSSSTAGP
jgi:hypothetical protein